MDFNSLLFIVYFIQVFLIVFKIFPKRYRYLILLLFSIIFYAYNSLFDLAMLLIVGLINYLFARLIYKSKNNILFFTSLFINISTLAIFKYNENLALPLGISFYTFNNISYIIDVKKEKISPEMNIFYLLAYEFMFPTISMGPLSRYKSIRNDFDNLDISYNSLLNGGQRFIWGFIKKSIFADNLSILYQQIMNIHNPTSMLYWMSLIVFGLQLYIDFSSYSDMAIGLGKIIGINYSENFDYPYLEDSISSFWRKWHMSLTNFFKEYVYFPLGGNRVSTIRNIINILVVWILTGIWHGSQFNYLLWGLYYGTIIIIEKFILNKFFHNVPKFFKHLYVIFTVLIGYVLFSVDDINQIIPFIKILFTGQLYNNEFVLLIKNNIVIIIISILLCFKKPNFISQLENNKYFSFITNMIQVALFIISLSYILSGNYIPSLYRGF